MPRIRSIKPEHRAHRKIGPLSDAQYRLWVSMIVEADDEGVFLCDASQLRAQTWAYHAMDVVDVETMIQAIAKRGAIRLYRVGKIRYACFPSWARHQHPKYPQKSSNPPPPFPHRSPNGSPRVRNRSTSSREGRVEMSREGREKKEGSAEGNPDVTVSHGLTIDQSTNGAAAEYPVPFALSDAWRKEHRNALRAQGWSPTRADTQAGRLVAAEVIFYRQHGKRPAQAL